MYDLLKFLKLSGGYSAGEHFVDIEGVTGSIPVSPTISTKIKYVRNNKDLACKPLKLLGYFNCLVRRWSEYTLITICKIRSKTPPKSIKVSCKCLVKFSRVHRDRARGSQEMSIGFTGLCLVNTNDNFDGFYNF